MPIGLPAQLHVRHAMRSFGRGPHRLQRRYESWGVSELLRVRPELYQRMRNRPHRRLCQLSGERCMRCCRKCGELCGGVL